MARHGSRRKGRTKAPLDQITGELLRGFVTTSKTLAVPIAWTTEGRNFRFQVPIDIDGITELGLTLIGRASTAVPDRHVSLNLAYRTPEGAGGTFERLDWRPIDVHRNRGDTKPELALKEICGTHHHPWALNEHLSMEEALDYLPVAEPVQPEPTTWAELLLFAARVWNIDGLSELPLPPWEPSLL
jgi:hypothetical protein